MNNPHLAVLRDRIDNLKREAEKAYTVATKIANERAAERGPCSRCAEIERDRDEYRELHNQLLQQLHVQHSVEKLARLTEELLARYTVPTPKGVSAPKGAEVHRLTIAGIPIVLDYSVPPNTVMIRTVEGRTLGHFSLPSY